MHPNTFVVKQVSHYRPVIVSQYAIYFPVEYQVSGEGAVSGVKEKHNPGFHFQNNLATFISNKPYREKTDPYPHSGVVCF